MIHHSNNTAGIIFCPVDWSDFWSVIAWLGLTIRSRRPARFVHTLVLYHGFVIDSIAGGTYIYHAMFSDRARTTTIFISPKRVRAYDLPELSMSGEFMWWLGHKVPICTSTVEYFFNMSVSYRSPDELYYSISTGGRTK